MHYDDWHVTVRWGILYEYLGWLYWMMGMVTCLWAIEVLDGFAKVVMAYVVTACIVMAFVGTCLLATELLNGFAKVQTENTTY